MAVEERWELLSQGNCEDARTEERLKSLHFIDYSSSIEERADPGGTAIPGQPVLEVEQAPKHSS